ncbi:MAG TPA: M15 family metallopeptidase [Candidatus Gallacutalibacter pullistercoris]|nr:M15 family metallopeptidase [Candidatus Gallacutalibacter pullistercoris]
MKHTRKHGEKIVKAKPSGYEEREIRRLGRIRIAIGMLLLGVVAASGWLVWERVTVPYEKAENTDSSISSSPSSKEETLPVYTDDFNLKLANQENSLTEEQGPELTEYQGIQVDERIVPALEALLKAAEEADVPLQLVSGYVSPEEQDELFQKEVERLIKEESYSRVMAEQTASQNVAPGNQDDSQTGMSVVVQSEKESSDFSSTAEYRWLYRHCIDYGFVFRYPEGKKSYTGRDFDPNCIRYVGEKAAARMRQLQMSLEEYVDYVG